MQRLLVLGWVSLVVVCGSAVIAGGCATTTDAPPGSDAGHLSDAGHDSHVLPGDDAGEDASWEDAAADATPDGASDCTVPQDCTQGSICAEANCVGYVCQYSANTSLCGATGNECTSFACSVTTGCSEVNAADTTPCDGGAGQCISGQCQPVTDCTGAGDCTDGAACTIPSCPDGTCVYTPNHGACNDGNQCTVNTCTGTGCQTTNVAAGATCSGGFCNGAGMCVQCLDNGHCNDSNACTNDICSGGTCSNTAVDCNDGNACTVNFCDTTLGCGGTTVVCDDTNECTANTCDPSMGCTHPNLPNGTTCSIGECQSGVCEPIGTVPPRVFRMNQLVLVDPHIIADKTVSTLLGSCRLCQDITHGPKTHRCSFFIAYTQDVDLPGLNPALNDLVTADGNGDGYLDLSFMLAFAPHTQVHEAGGSVRATEGLCLEADQTNCIPDPDALVDTTVAYTSQTSGTCLGPITGTLRSSTSGFTPGDYITPNTVSGACFVSGPTVFALTLEFELGGQTELIQISMQQSQIAGQWVGNPATSISNGLLRGFLRMQDADQQSLTINVDLVGNVNINLGRDLLPDSGSAHGCGGVARSFPAGGTGGSNAHALGTHLQNGCGTNPGDWRDLLNTGSGASYQNCGWWFYINYTGIWAANASGF
jgi:hypothetical protein